MVTTKIKMVNLTLLKIPFTAAPFDFIWMFWKDETAEISDGIPTTRVSEHFVVPPAEHCSVLMLNTRVGEVAALLRRSVVYIPRTHASVIQHFQISKRS